jgi:hypothetical protein
MLRNQVIAHILQPNNCAYIRLVLINGTWQDVAIQKLSAIID